MSGASDLGTRTKIELGSLDTYLGAYFIEAGIDPSGDYPL